MRTLHQLIPAAVPFDAVTQQAVAWRDILRRHGIESEVHAEHIHPKFADDARQTSRFRPGRDEGAVLHYSIWSSTAERALALDREQLGINYQNITPGKLIEQVNPIIAELCDRGRRELHKLALHASVVIAPSTFNARDLEEAGRSDVEIVPLILQMGTPPPVRAVVLPRILTVGRIVPNKCLEDVIRTLALLREVSLPAATLDIVGSAEGFERYRLSLERFAKALGVSDAVTFHGRVTEAERNGLYSDAGAYLCMSEHEGFCVPLIEALSQGLPVVARGAGAVPETLGGSGLILPDGDAAVAAEALALVLTDVQVRQGLRAHSIRRLEQLAPERIEARLMAALQPLVG